MRTLLSIILFCLACFCKAENTIVEIIFLDANQQIISSEQISITDVEHKQPNPVFTIFKKKQRLNKKITAAALAFPFPFGIVGLHRIYLGTKPYVPVAYIASLGGVFGILPFIDFCAIVFDKDFDYYKDNGKVLMWVRE